MTVSLPMVAIFAVIVWYLLRTGSLRLGSATACALLGLYTGATPAGPAINHATHAVFAAILGAIAHL
ncbi:hypothetical protein [Streptacidiphilus anmyonensis]|uniref:hypothetical protein n=1 Tax=Streptacidiphilus anmyonensis TaxID=405782 RepID=UPI0005A9A676|nr:hypothetical protein [Streptacidiphilus anmyonensis]